jgi:hypothetical protein
MVVSVAPRMSGTHHIHTDNAVQKIRVIVSIDIVRAATSACEQIRIRAH